jgi:hypothetical protein
VKRALASLAGLIGLAALGRWLAQRRRPAEPVADTVADPVAAPVAAPVADPIAADAAGDPAEELRRKLADARDAEPEDEAAAEPESLDERRARVHAKAREAIDAMGDDEVSS